MILAMFLAMASQDADARVILEPAPSDRIATSATLSAGAQPGQVIPIEVHVTAGNKQLFSDTLLVGRSAGASYSQSRSEALKTPCPENSAYNQSQQTSLNIQLYWNDLGNAGQATNVSVQWQRPQAAADCTSGGTRGVQVSQMVRLSPGESVTIHGDADLTVRVTRR